MTEWDRGVALGGVLVLTGAYGSVLGHVADVTGGGATLVGVLVGSLVLGAALGRTVGPRPAGAVVAVVAVAGAAGYALSVPPGQRGLLFTPKVVGDTVALLSGLSVLRLTNAGVWALGVAPGPTVLAWYLAVRRRYVWSVVAGGAALALLVLTGDAGGATTLAGVAGAALAAGVGEADLHGARTPRVDAVVAVVAAMVVVSATLSAAVGGVAAPLVGGDRSPTVESSVVEARDSVRILGDISLSPQVRFEVESERGVYWQTAAYDRYTGAGWVRTGETTPYEGERSGPPGAAETVDQRVRARTTLGSLPAAWRPVAVEGADAVVTPQGGLRPATRVTANESYRVRSRVPQYTTAQLRRAGTDYPADVERTYTALPGSTPDRVRERAAAVTANATTPYGRAAAIEAYLEREKQYSLDVDAPDGKIADSFLFEMDAGYCTYYATTMVTMLRSQGVPARFVVGYTPGEQTGEDEYVVRGFDSHAWVQVYFPDVGWVRFDPTPAAPRQAAEQRSLVEAREGDAVGIDIGVTAPTTGNDSGTVNVTPRTPVSAANTTSETPTGTATPAATPAGGAGVSLPALPPPRTVAVWLVAAAGALAVGRRTGALDRLRDTVALRRQPRGTPDEDAVRAYDRLETLFARRHRPRTRGETPRGYVRALVADGADEAALTVVGAYERARHGDGVDRATADEAVAIVDRLVAARGPSGGRADE